MFILLFFFLFCIMHWIWCEVFDSFRFQCLGALPVDPVDRINEIVDDIDDLDAIEQIPGEAKFYRTSTETYDDDFVPPQYDVPDDDTTAPQTQSLLPKIESVPREVVHRIETTSVPQEVEHEMELTESPAIDLFMDLMKIFADVMVPKTEGNGRKGHENTDTDMEVKTEELPFDETNTTSDAIDELIDGTTELYAPKTLKRPIVSQTVKDVLQAFKALHNWRFTK